MESVLAGLRLRLETKNNALLAHRNSALLFLTPLRSKTALLPLFPQMTVSKMDRDRTGTRKVNLFFFIVLDEKST